MQDPDQAAPGEFLAQPLDHLCLGMPLERRGRLVEDHQIGALQDGPGDRRALALAER